MRKAETGMGLFLVIVALVLLREAFRLPISWTAIGPGAGFFPFWLAVGVAVTAVIVFARSLRPAAITQPGGDVPFIPGTAWKPLAVVFFPMAAIILFMKYLGIYIGGAIYLGGYMWLVGRHRWISVVIVSVLIPLVLFFIFERWFLLPLPKGVLLEQILYGR